MELIDEEIFNGCNELIFEGLLDQDWQSASMIWLPVALTGNVGVRPGLIGAVKVTLVRIQ
jgi:hypothetical protein